VRVNYDYIYDYILNIGQITMTMINSEHDRAAQLAVEVWTSISDVELLRKSQGKQHQNIILGC